MQESTTVQGQQIYYTRKTIPVDKCVLDPQNPRIQYAIGLQNTSITEKELDAMLWAKDSVKSLSQEIMQNGGVRDHILVQETPEGNYLVREGNCRTVSLRHLLEEYPDDIRFKLIPAMIFTETLSDENLAVMLTDWHVSGRIPWDGFEKAKMVHTLHTKHGKPYEWLAINMRLSKSKIKDLLDSFQQMEDFLKQYPNESVKKFSRFAETIKKKAIKNKLDSDPVFKQTFYGWLKDNKLTENHHIRELPSILENPIALDALNKYGFKEAHSIIVKSDPALESSLFSSIKTATDNLKAASITEIQELSGDTKKIAMLKDLHTATLNLASISKVQLV